MAHIRVDHSQGHFWFSDSLGSGECHLGNPATQIKLDTCNLTLKQFSPLILWNFIGYSTKKEPKPWLSPGIPLEVVSFTQEPPLNLLCMTNRRKNSSFLYITIFTPTSLLTSTSSFAITDSTTMVLFCPSINFYVPSLPLCLLWPLFSYLVLSYSSCFLFP